SGPSRTPASTSNSRSREGTTTPGRRGSSATGPTRSATARSRSRARPAGASRSIPNGWRAPRIRSARRIESAARAAASGEGRRLLLAGPVLLDIERARLLAQLLVAADLRLLPERHRTPVAEGPFAALRRVRGAHVAVEHEDAIVARGIRPGAVDGVERPDG